MPLFSDAHHGKEARSWDETKITFDLHWCAKCHIEFQLLRWNFVSTFHFGHHIFICAFGTHSIHVYLIHSNTILFSMSLLLLALLFGWYISADSFGIYLWRSRHTEISPFIGITDREKTATASTTTTTIIHNIVYDILIYSIYTNKHINTAKTKTESANER